MSWSTREIAELTGVTVRAVRHYHEVGLLAEPQRRANGYKKYGGEHLVRILRIKRLTELGFSLPRIAAMGESTELPRDAVMTLHEELTASIAHLEQARGRLQVMLNDPHEGRMPLT